MRAAIILSGIAWICHLGDFALRRLVLHVLPVGTGVQGSVMHGWKELSPVESTTNMHSQLFSADCRHASLPVVAGRLSARVVGGQAKGESSRRLARSMGCCLCHWIYALAGSYPACTAARTARTRRPRRTWAKRALVVGVVSALSQLHLSGTCTACSLMWGDLEVGCSCLYESQRYNSDSWDMSSINVGKFQIEWAYIATLPSVASTSCRQLTIARCVHRDGQDLHNKVRPWIRD
jgi:hypothetical protein